jgi:thioredoxin reductase (NADPH)|tara:strand:+ start:1745 stop:2776 length:1032 start_codon:yes stop_codon:yes gene_type:complete
MLDIQLPGNHHKTDVVIIGAGPCGLFTVFELGLLDVKAHLIDNLDKIGGQCSELYPDKNLYDIPSRPSVTGQELTDDLIKQAQPFKPSYHLNQLTSEIILNQDSIIVKTNAGTVIECKSIVIAAGSGCFVSRPLPVENTKEFEGKNIFYSVKDRQIFKNKNILIAGGGDSALDYVLGFKGIANSINLIHRRNEFKAVQDSVNKMMTMVDNKEANFFVNTIKSLKDKDNGQVDVELADGTIIEKIDAIFPFFGLKIELGPIAEWGLNLENNLISVNTENFETSVPRVFAVGDICQYPGKLKLILSGFHEAALAAKKIFHYCSDKKYVFRYTTSSSDLKKKLGVM